MPRPVPYSSSNDSNNTNTGCQLFKTGFKRVNESGSYPACSCSRVAWPCRAGLNGARDALWSVDGIANNECGEGSGGRRSASCGTTRSCTCTRPSAIKALATILSL